ncbi:helix-turn-helix domain-containing protein [Parabacteroides sp. FAFU027]|uniref:helix-turn-helix domain-containing protein n=1 Tax=Parabacteroides sp. FAFU027 TaxID=2922715 RepID=UPI001FAE7E06|nr:helix-turn-helix domain-containing protein [Parabacteroides sp. FAFU027]
MNNAGAMEKECIYTQATQIEYLSLETHIHPCHNQLIYMIKGTLYVHTGEYEYFLPEGFIGIIPRGRAHSLRSGNEQVKMFLIYYPEPMKNEELIVFNSNDFIIENIRYISKQAHVLDKKKHEVLFRFTGSFLRVLEQGSSDISFPVKGLITPRNERLAHVMQYLKSNFKEDVSLKTVASEFGFTERNLTRLFKKENISFNNCLNYIRIVKALELFAEHSSHIEQVAYDVGYNSAGNFSRTFKKFTGYTPSEYLKKNSNNSISP